MHWIDILIFLIGFLYLKYEFTSLSRSEVMVIRFEMGIGGPNQQSYVKPIILAQLTMLLTSHPRFFRIFSALSQKQYEIEPFQLSIVDTIN